MDRNKALRKLEAKLRNPDYRTIEERAPVIRLKNGKRVMVENSYFPGVRGRSYRVSLDFGLTCKEIGRATDLDGVLDIILEQGK